MTGAQASPAADLATALLELGEKVGIAPERWRAREKWHEVTAPQKTLGHREIAACRAELLALATAGGAALDLSLAVASLADEARFPDPWKSKAKPDDGDRLDSFLAQFDTLPDLKLRLSVRLDKLAFAATLLGEPPRATQVTLFLFVEGLASFLSTFAGLKQLDERWGDDPEGRWLCLLPGWRADRPAAERLLRGPYLTLFGGDPGELPAAEAEDDGEVRLRQVTELRDEQLRWESRWLERLTPFHLALRGKVEASDAVVATLRWQFAVLAMLYTADRVRGGDARDARPATAVYQGADRRLEVRLAEPDEALATAGLSEEALAGVAAWDRICQWCYSREGSVGDRLAMVQNVVCREAWGASAENAFLAVVTRAPTILDQVRHGWKTFIEGKVDTFFGQIQSVEDAVAGTVQGGAEQIGKLVTQLTTTALAGVGVLLGALLLPVLKEGTFDPWIVAVGMAVYALYVLIVPGFYGLWPQWQAQRALEAGFDERYARFRRRLPSHLVDEVGRAAVDAAGRRFRVWFWATVAAFAALVVLLVAGAALFGLAALVS